jgi:hypothetical protein
MPLSSTSKGPPLCNFGVLIPQCCIKETFYPAVGGTVILFSAGALQQQCATIQCLQCCLLVG